MSEDTNKKNHFMIEIELYYSIFNILSPIDTVDQNIHIQLIDNFWSTVSKTNCKRLFTLDYIVGNNMVKPEIIKDYLVTQASYISSLSLEDICICVSILTPTYSFIYDYLSTTVLNKDVNILVNKEPGVPQKSSSEARHSTYSLSQFKSLWFLLFSILKEDDLFHIQNINEFMIYCTNNQHHTLEDLVQHFTTKELRISQKRFLALSIEQKLVYDYISKLNNIISNGPIYNINLSLFYTQTFNNSSLFYKDNSLYYPILFQPYTFQQKYIYTPESNIDDKPATIIQISNKQRYKIFPDANIVKNQIVTDRGVYSISTPKASQNTTSIILNFAYKHKINIQTIIEGAAGLGGNLFSFLTIFKNVIGIEPDNVTFEALKNNCNMYKKQFPKKYKANLDLIHNSIIQALPSLSKKYKIDAIFMSPPWGGINFTNASNITYYLDKKPLWNVVKYLLSFTHLVFLDLGKNINIKEFISNLTEYSIETIDRTEYAYLVCIYSPSFLNSFETDLNIVELSNNNNLNTENSKQSIFINKKCNTLCLDLLINQSSPISIKNIILPTYSVFKTINTLHLKPYDYFIERTIPFPSKEFMFKKFASYFKDDLLDWKKSFSKPHWIVKGGYSIKQLLEYKYKDEEISDSIQTKDIDLNVSIKDSKQRDNYVNYIINKCHQFFNSTSFYFLFNIEVVTFKPPVYNRIENNNLYYLILLRYQNTDWIDIGFVDYSISEKMIDWNISETVGFPIKTVDSYMDEIVTLVYQANVKDVDNFTFKKRNPVKGSLFKKGIQDLERSQILCELDSAIYEDYKDYCDYTLSLTKDDIYYTNIDFEFLKHYFRKKIHKLKNIK